MGQPIYFTDPAAAAAYFVHPGEWAWVENIAEAAWLLANRHGYSLNARQALPGPYFVHPQAPLPFVPWPPPAPEPPPSPEPAPPPASRRRLAPRRDDTDAAE